MCFTFAGAEFSLVQGLFSSCTQQWKNNLCPGCSVMKLQHASARSQVCAFLATSDAAKVDVATFNLTKEAKVGLIGERSL
ncbi:unnamed protein product [Clavelina lepadiformis]|uniref:Uncharacterized protein n=1 Tax=Clavelina lepadiformis TaxID=159417 RepID=A0ABP0GU70_CLALP